MLYISGERVAELLDMKSCISLMDETLRELSGCDTVQPLRASIGLSGNNALGIMPAALTRKRLAGAKIISIFPDNFYKGLPSHQGAVMLFETETGKLLAIVDGEAVTAVRTAAVSAVATGALARQDAESLALLGSGCQARQHVHAMRLVRPIRRVSVWDADYASARRFADEIGREIGLPVLVCDNCRQAAQSADIICTVTAAREPILFGADVRPGTHINAVGACRADCRELDSALVRKSRFFGDKRESVLNEAGDLLIPIANREADENMLLGEIGDVLLGKIKGRRSLDDITIFESLGLAAEDIAATGLVYDRYTAQQGKAP